MRSRFDEQLALLNRELIEMGALCEEVIALSAQALTEGNAELAARVYADLDGLYAKCGISTRAGKIFAAYYLRREPLEHVARRFGVTGNVVYVTAARVREKLAAYGPDFVSAA